VNYLKKETLQIDDRYGSEFVGQYIFQEITWAKRNRILQKYTKYNPQTGAVISTDYVAIQAETTFSSIITQPSNKPITLERLLSEDSNGIPIELGEKLAKITNNLSIISVEETKNS
jgi:hypothetical protein